MADAATYCARLDIDLDAVVANWRLIGNTVAPATAAAVIKANGYGLGAAEVGRALADAGCRHFFVAHLIEGLRVRPALPDDVTVFILNGLMPGSEATCLAAGLVPVLNSLEQIARWSALAIETGRDLPAVLQVDTGMARMGLTPEEAALLLAEPDRLTGITLVLTMSHLACADDALDDFSVAQQAKFENLTAGFPEIPRALDNSGGAFLKGLSHFDIVRPGIALYGGAPNNGPNPMRAVATLTTQIVQLRDIAAGTSVGYGRTFVADRPTRVATIPVGYADGWHRSLSNRGSAFIAGHRVPIIGRVSMDSITLDVTDIPEEYAFPGAAVELLGPHQTVDDVARDAGTISYEILTSLGQRYERCYHGGGAE